MLQADFPGATGAACPQSPSHLPPDFNALPRELPRLFPSLGLGADRFFFFFSSTAADTKLQCNRKATFLFFFFFFCTGTEQEKGADFVLGSATGYAWKMPRQGHVSSPRG